MGLGEEEALPCPAPGGDGTQAAPLPWVSGRAQFPGDPLARLEDAARTRLPDLVLQEGPGEKLFGGRNLSAALESAQASAYLLDEAPAHCYRSPWLPAEVIACGPAAPC